jgi:hypothetical protein
MLRGGKDHLNLSTSDPAYFFSKGKKKPLPRGFLARILHPSRSTIHLIDHWCQAEILGYLLEKERELEKCRGFGLMRNESCLIAFYFFFAISSVAGGLKSSL